MANNPGGGHKINMLKPVIAEYKEKNDLLIMFTDRLKRIQHNRLQLTMLLLYLVMMSFWQPVQTVSSKSSWTLKQMLFSLLRDSVGQTNH